MDKNTQAYLEGIEKGLERVKFIVGWQKAALVMAKEMAQFYTRLPTCDPGPAKRFLKSLETRPKLEPTDA